MAAPAAPDLSDKQTLFLGAFRETGTLRKAAAAAHVGRSTVQRWTEDNVNGFRAAFEEAKDDFADEMEDIMFSLVKQMKPGHNPTLIIFMLKALRPLKYRELTHIPDEHAQDLMRKLEKWPNAVPPAPVRADDRPETELTALEQVNRILKGNADAREST